MPIVMSRSGTVLSAPEVTQEQSNKMWEALIRKWAKKHPEALKQPQPDTSATLPTRAAAADCAG